MLSLLSKDTHRDLLFLVTSTPLRPEMETGEPPPKLIAAHRSRTTLGEDNQIPSPREALSSLPLLVWRGREQPSLVLYPESPLFHQRGPHSDSYGLWGQQRRRLGADWLHSLSQGRKQMLRNPAGLMLSLDRGGPILSSDPPSKPLFPLSRSRCGYLHVLMIPWICQSPVTVSRSSTSDLPSPQGKNSVVSRPGG